MCIPEFTENIQFKEPYHDGSEAPLLKITEIHISCLLHDLANKIPPQAYYYTRKWWFFIIDGWEFEVDTLAEWLQPASIIGNTFQRFETIF